MFELLGCEITRNARGISSCTRAERERRLDSKEPLSGLTLAHPVPRDSLCSQTENYMESLRAGWATNLVPRVVTFHALRLCPPLDISGHKLRLKRGACARSYLGKKDSFNLFLSKRRKCNISRNLFFTLQPGILSSDFECCSKGLVSNCSFHLRGLIHGS